MKIQPQTIKVIDKNLLFIKWSDGVETFIKLANLRRACPCAVCNSEREENGLKYFPIYSGDQIKILEIKIVGHYALNIIWKDGHNTGIYEFVYLRSLPTVESNQTNISTQ